MLLFTVLSAFADPLDIERGRYALATDRALEARAHALQAIRSDRADWRGWHLYQSACIQLAMGGLCKADLDAAAEEEPPVDIVNTWFDFQADRADIEALEGTDHPELRALATGALHESTLPEARAAALLEAVRYAPAEVEQLSRDALSAHPDHPEIQVALWEREDPNLEKARKRVLKAGKKLEGRPVVELYRWLRLYQGAKERDRQKQVRALLEAGGESFDTDDAGPPMSLDASFAAADERILTAASPTDRDGALLPVDARRLLLAGAFRQRLALHGESRNPRSRLDRATANALAGDPNDPKRLALACKSVRGEPCADRPDLASAYAARAQRNHAAGELDQALVDIVVATTLQPYAPPSWYTLRAELQGEGFASFVSRSLAWEVGGDEPDGGLGSGWPGPGEAGEQAALAAIEAWSEKVADPTGEPYDRDRAARTLATDREDHKELLRMAFLAYLDQDDSKTDKLLDRFTRLYPHDPMGHVALGRVLHRRGLLTEAEAAYRAAVALEDEHAHDEEEGARIDTKGTHVHGAEEEITFEPPPPEAWSGLALVLARQERLEEAKQTLVHLDEHAGSTPMADLHRAIVHEAAGEREPALAHLDWALKTREQLDAAGRTQLRILLYEEPLLDELRATDVYRRRMLQAYGRTGLRPVSTQDR